MDDLIYNLNDKKQLFLSSMDQKIEDAKNRLSKDPQNVEIMSELAKYSCIVGMNDLSIYFAEEALKISPFSLKLLTELSHYYCLVGREQDAHSLLLKIVNEDKYFNDASSLNIKYIKKCIFSLSKNCGDKKNAISLFEKSFKLYSNNKDLMILAVFIKRELLAEIKESRKLLSILIKNYEMNSSILIEWISFYEFSSPKKVLLLTKILKKRYPIFGDSFNMFEFAAYSSIGDKKNANKCLEKYDDKINYLFQKIHIDLNFIKTLNLDELISQFDEILKDSNDIKYKEFNYPLALLSFIISQKYKDQDDNKKKNSFLEKAHRFQFKANYLSLENKTSILTEMPNYLNEFSKKALRLIKNRKFDEQNNPIYIIGLPRSGSTLVEKILFEKFNCFSLGECSIIRKYINNLAYKNKIFDPFEFYRREFKFLSKDRYFSDKNLTNFIFIDVILKLFPNAKFINCLRNPKENILAIYNVLLSRVPWTHNIENILEFASQYYSIMDKYKNIYDDKIFNLHHSKLSVEPEVEIEKLSKFIGFNTKPVNKIDKKNNWFGKTSSQWQVREKISKKYLNKYFDDYHLLDKYIDSYPWLKNNS